MGFPVPQSGPPKKAGGGGTSTGKDAGGATGGGKHATKKLGQQLNQALTIDPAEIKLDRLQKDGAKTAEEAMEGIRIAGRIRRTYEKIVIANDDTDQEAINAVVDAHEKCLELDQLIQELKLRQQELTLPAAPTAAGAVNQQNVDNAQQDKTAANSQQSETVVDPDDATTCVAPTARAMGTNGTAENQTNGSTLTSVNNSDSVAGPNPAINGDGPNAGNAHDSDNDAPNDEQPDGAGTGAGTGPQPAAPPQAQPSQPAAPSSPSQSSEGGPLVLNHPGKGVGVMPAGGLPPNQPTSYVGALNRKVAEADREKLDFRVIDAAHAELAKLDSPNVAVLPSGTDACNYDVQAFAYVATSPWLNAYAALQGENPHVRGQMMRAKEVHIMSVAGKNSLIILKGPIVKDFPQGNPSNDHVHFHSDPTEFVNLLDDADDSKRVLVQGTMDVIKRHYDDVSFRFALNPKPGKDQLVEASGVPKSSDAPVVNSMNFNAFVGADKSNKWATIKLVSKAGDGKVVTVKDRLAVLRVVSSSVPGLQVLLRGTTARAFVADGWTHELKEKVKATAGVASVFTDVFVRGPQSTTAQTPAQVEKERAATLINEEAELEQKALEDMEKGNNDTRVLCDSVSLEKLNLVIEKIGGKVIHRAKNLIAVVVQCCFTAAGQSEVLQKLHTMAIAKVTDTTCLRMPQRA
jgi:hypothetical protein